MGRAVRSRRVLTVEDIVGDVPERWETKSILYWRDPSGLLDRLARRCVAKYFPALQYVRLLFVWRRPFHYSKDICPIPSQIRILGKRERDIFGVDVIFELDPEYFLSISKRNRLRSVYHLLRHIGVSLTDEMRPEVDACGRVQITLQKHDLYIRTFKDEVRRFGKPQAYADVLAFLEKFSGDEDASQSEEE